MTTKCLIKSVLAVGLVLIMSSTASAWVSGTSTSQTSCTTLQIRLGQCSIRSEGLLRGLGNTTNDPTAYSVKLLIKEGTFVMRNPAGNSKQAVGTPFTDLFVEVEASDLINADQISRNGRATAEIVFHDADIGGVPGLISTILPALETKCAADPTDLACEVLRQIALHPNWLQTVVVTKLEVLGIQFVDDDVNSNTCVITTLPGLDGQLGTDDDITNIIGDCPVEDALGQKCDAPAAVVADAKAFAWQAFNYACNPVCHDRDGTTCSPYTLPLP